MIREDKRETKQDKEHRERSAADVVMPGDPGEKEHQVKYSVIFEILYYSHVWRCSIYKLQNLKTQIAVIKISWGDVRNSFNLFCEHQFHSDESLQQARKVKEDPCRSSHKFSI